MQHGFVPTRPLGDGLVPFDDLSLAAKVHHVFRVVFSKPRAMLTGFVCLGVYAVCGFFSVSSHVVNFVSKTLQLTGVSPTLLAGAITIFGVSFLCGCAL